MERIQPVINWFTDRGGKYFGDSAPSYYRDENYEGFVEIEHSGNHEVQYRGLQIFMKEISWIGNNETVVVQFLLEHGRNDDEDDLSLEDAINELEPLVPEDAELDINYSIGTDVFLLRELNTEELRPEKLNEILTPLTKFAEFAMSKVSIFHTAPQLKLKNQLATG